MVLEKVKRMEGWKEESWMVRDNLVEWLVNNKERRLVEEAEDILDGLEQMVEDGDMGMEEELLIEATEVVTSVVLAWNLDVERITFVKAGKEDEAFHGWRESQKARQSRKYEEDERGVFQDEQP